MTIAYLISLRDGDWVKRSGCYEDILDGSIRGVGWMMFGWLFKIGTLRVFSVWLFQG